MSVNFSNIFTLKERAGLRSHPFWFVTAAFLLLQAPINRPEASLHDSEHRNESLVSLGDQAFRTRQWKAALAAYRLAMKGGYLSSDTLCLLIARVYMYKGHLDTALAYNSAFKAKSGTSLQLEQLRQRLALYTLLDWPKERIALTDTLQRETRRHRTSRFVKVLIPQFSLLTTAGSRYEAERSAAGPFQGGLAYSALEQKGPHLLYGLNAKLAWYLPTKAARFGLLIRGSAAKHPNTNPGIQHAGFLDSLWSQSEKRLQCSGQIENLFGFISMHAGYFRSQSYAGNWSDRFKATLYHFSFGKKISRYLGIEYSCRLDQPEWMVTGILMLDPTLVGTRGVVLNLTGSLYHARVLQYSTNYNAMAIDDTLFEHTIFCRLLNTDELTNPENGQDLGYIYLSMPNRNTAGINPAGMLSIVEPQDFITLSADLSYRFRTVKRVYLEMGAGFQTDYYLHNTWWSTLTASPATITGYAEQNEITLIYDRSSANYYWHLADGSNIPAFSFHEKRRIDYTPSIFGQIDLATGRGTISIKGEVAKTWSRLRNELPTMIDDIDVRFTTTWYVRIG